MVRRRVEGGSQRCHAAGAPHAMERSDTLQCAERGYVSRAIAVGVQVVFDLQTLFLLSGVVTQARVTRSGTRTRTDIHAPPRRRTYTTHAIPRPVYAFELQGDAILAKWTESFAVQAGACCARARGCVRGRPACAGTFAAHFIAVVGAAARWRLSRASLVPWVAVKARRRRNLRQAADGSEWHPRVLTGTRGYLEGARVPAGAAADGSAWTTVLSKAGGATVRGRARAWVCVRVRARLRAPACACARVCVGLCSLRATPIRRTESPTSSPHPSSRGPSAIVLKGYSALEYSRKGVLLLAVPVLARSVVLKRYSALGYSRGYPGGNSQYPSSRGPSAVVL